MTRSDQLTDPPIDTLLPVPLEVQPQYDLGAEQELEDPGEGGVDVVADELAAGVRVAEEEADDSEGGAEDLGWDVPAGFADLFVQMSVVGRSV